MNSKLSILGLFALLSLNVNGENANLNGILDHSEARSLELETTTSASIPKTFNLKLNVMFDTGAFRRYRRNYNTVLGKINRALTSLEGILKWRGPLVTAFQLEFVPNAIIHYDSYLRINSENGGTVAGNLAEANKDDNADIYLIFVKPTRGFTQAVSKQGGVCSPNRKHHGAIVALQSDEQATIHALAHSIGLLLGMTKDDAVTHPGGKNDKLGRSCSDIGSIMDTKPAPTTWSRCNLEDFYKYWKKNEQNFCLQHSDETLTIDNSA